MKQNVKMSRTVGQLEKIFRLLNSDLFDNALEIPVITVIPTPKAYGHYTLNPLWEVGGGRKHEINIGAGTLNRPLEETVATLLHEMIHYYNDTVLNVQDCSRGGTYHNKFFKRTAESHGLTCERSDRYGYSHTTLNDDMILWLCEHDELNEIEMNRTDFRTVIGIGTKEGESGTLIPPTISTTGHHRKYACPCCGLKIRATKEVHLHCNDCNLDLIQIG